MEVKTLTCSLTDQSVRNLLIQIVTLHATNPSVGWLLIQKFSTETSVEWRTTVSISSKSTDSGLECRIPKDNSRITRMMTKKQGLQPDNDNNRIIRIPAG